jgi:hypothetical protein
MYLTVHGTAAMLIARSVPNPFLAFLLALSSHFVLDFIPHGDEHIIQKHFTRGKTLRRLVGYATVDGIILAGFLAIFIWFGPLNISRQTVFWSLLGSLLPDLLQGFYFATEARWLKRFQDFHVSIHNASSHALTWHQGLLVQSMVLTALWLNVMF